MVQIFGETACRITVKVISPKSGLRWLECNKLTPIEYSYRRMPLLKELNLNESITANLSQLSTSAIQHSLAGIRRGIERETLRILPSGRLAQTPHAAELGSALTHPWITTDFSESLLEFITPAQGDAEQMLAQLADIHSFTAKQLGDEQIWPLSMPCYIQNQDEIPLAQYGQSNIGRMKTLYRQGLKNRYGAMMQAIAGVHFNFSFSEQFWQDVAHSQQAIADQHFISAQYLAIIRNFKRHVWLLTYLFGASPALCSSFLEGKAHNLPFRKLGKGTLYLPFATSLRMGDLGYTNSAQSELKIKYNNLDEYIAGLRNAISTPVPRFEQLGVKVDGEYRQLNSNLLQIENEFYSTIRPKRTPQSGEKPSEALERGGIDYIEVRCLDVNPFSAVGIELSQVYFLDVFLFWCWLQDSPELNECETELAQLNLDKVIIDGRDHNLCLYQACGSMVKLRQRAEQIFEQLAEVAQFMDNAMATDRYQAAVQKWYVAVQDPEQTLSGQLLKAMLKSEQDSVSLALTLSKLYKEQLLTHEYQAFTEQQFQQHAEQSRLQQQQIERADSVDFDRFLQQYFAKRS